MAAQRTSVSIAALLGMLAAVPLPATAQQAANWAGAIRCEIQVSAVGYTHQEIQTWTLTGGAPTVQGSVSAYPATWSVSGQGRHDRTGSSSRRVAQWTVNLPAAGSPASAPIGFTRHAVGPGLDVTKWHAQLTVGGGYTGTDQFYNNGVPQAATRMAATVYEWQFPKIEAAATDIQLTGSSTSQVKAFVGPLQPGEATPTVTCTWALARGTAPALPPPATVSSTPGGAASGGMASTPPVSTPPVSTPPVSTPPASTAGAPGVPPASTGPAPATPSVSASPGSAPTNALRDLVPQGGLTATTAAPNTAPPTPVDPADFTATQAGEGTVRLTWSAVPGAGSYILGGPGTGLGITVNGTSHVLSDIAPGAHTWTVATMYNPGGVLTTADRWSRAMTTVINTSGRYRIVINGFRVNREAAAGNFGEHNAVYAAAAVKVLGRSSGSGEFPVLKGPVVVRSRAHGDLVRDPTRVKAGSASSTGGLVAGDVLPAGQDPSTTTLEPSTTMFPLLLWEGTLTDGEEAVVVRPTLWHHNMSPDTFEFWRGLVIAPDDSMLHVIAARIRDADLSPFRATRNSNYRGWMFMCVGWEDHGIGTVCRSNMDRPIGLEGGKGGVYNIAYWTDLLLVFTREAVERALSSPYRTGGASGGVIQIHLADEEPGWNGNYDLFLRVERVP